MIYMNNQKTSASTLKILIISQHFPPEKSGNASRISDMAKYLVLDNCDVTVLAPHPSFPHDSFDKDWSISKKSIFNGVKLENLFAWQPASKDPGFVERMAYYLTFPLHAVIWTTLHHKQFDIIITSAPPIFTGFAGLSSKLIFKKKWVMDVRDLWINASISLGFLKQGSFFEKISRMYEQACYSRSDIISVTTQELGEDIVRTYKNISPLKVKVVPNGVDTAFFYPIQTEKKNQIIYAGNIGHAQDLENVILAMKKISDFYPLKFIIAGDGDIKEYLEGIVKDNGLEKFVEFPGLLPREDIPKMFCESLIGIAPLKKMKTLEYAVPTKAYEYMACGIPFVGSGEGEIRKLAERSGGGIISENSPESFADFIIELLSNTSRMDSMGTKGREFVEKHYSRQQIASGLKNNIYDIASGKKNQNAKGISHAEPE
jgi:glycosyltransferase involved in cell wall biosynthesis